MAAVASRTTTRSPRRRDAELIHIQDTRPSTHLLVRLAVLGGPRELRGAEEEVKQPLALGVEEEEGLGVRLGQTHPMTRVDLEAAEAAHSVLSTMVAATQAPWQEGRPYEFSGFYSARRRKTATHFSDPSQKANGCIIPQPTSQISKGFWQYLIFPIIFLCANSSAPPSINFHPHPVVVCGSW